MRVNVVNCRLSHCADPMRCRPVQWLPDMPIGRAGWAALRGESSGPGAGTACQNFADGRIVLLYREIRRAATRKQ